MSRIAISDRHAEVLERAGEEFEICQNDGINEDILAHLNDDKFVWRATFIEHISISIFIENGRRSFRLGV